MADQNVQGLNEMDCIYHTDADGSMSLSNIASQGMFRCSTSFKSLSISNIPAVNISVNPCNVSRESMVLRNTGTFDNIVETCPQIATTRIVKLERHVPMFTSNGYKSDSGRASSIVSHDVKLLDEKLDDNKDLKFEDNFEETGSPIAASMSYRNNHYEPSSMIETMSKDYSIQLHCRPRMMETTAAKYAPELLTDINFCIHDDEQFLEDCLSQRVVENDQSNNLRSIEDKQRLNDAYDVLETRIQVQNNLRSQQVGIHDLPSEPHQERSVHAIVESSVNTELDNCPTSSGLPFTQSEIYNSHINTSSIDYLTRTINTTWETRDDNSLKYVGVLSRSNSDISIGPRSICGSSDVEGNLSDDVRKILKKYGRLNKERSNKSSESGKMTETISKQKFAEDFFFLTESKDFESDITSDDSLGKKIRDLLASLDRKLDNDERLGRSLSVESLCQTNFSGNDDFQNTVNQLDHRLEKMKNSTDQQVLNILSSDPHINHTPVSQQQLARNAELITRQSILVSNFDRESDSYLFSMDSVPLSIRISDPKEPQSSVNKSAAFDAENTREILNKSKNRHTKECWMIDAYTSADNLNDRLLGLSLVSDSTDIPRYDLTEREKLNDIILNVINPSVTVIYMENIENQHPEELIADSLSCDGSVRPSILETSLQIDTRFCSKILIFLFFILME